MPPLHREPPARPCPRNARLTPPAGWRAGAGWGRLRVKGEGWDGNARLVDLGFIRRRGRGAGAPCSRWNACAFRGPCSALAQPQPASRRGDAKKGYIHDTRPLLLDSSTGGTGWEAVSCGTATERPVLRAAPPMFWWIDFLEIISLHRTQTQARRGMTISPLRRQRAADCAHGIGLPNAARRDTEGAKSRAARNAADLARRRESHLSAAAARDHLWHVPRV